ncbi:MAG TPA: hypothetical protein VFA32_01025, partial [Dehalococcoidia bacterium]|nr:hypothetical protein [Dehalococcoidia bacterium]
HWVQTRLGSWVLSLGDAGTLRLQRDGSGAVDVWSVVHLVRDHGPQVLHSALPLGYAMGVAEDFVRKRGARVLADPNAWWRSEPSTEKQLYRMRQWQLPTRPGMTRGEAHDLMLSVSGDWG